MKDMRAVRFNEKIKRVSTLVGNGGLALLIAAISRMYVIGVDPSAVLWFLFAIGSMWVGMQINELLGQEEEQ